MYLINHAGSELDPMDREAVNTMIKDGELSREDWVWDEITETWAPLNELFPENFPIFGSDLPEDLDESEMPTQAIPPIDPLDIGRFIREGQRQIIVEAILKVLDEVLEPGERLIQIATQRKPMPDLSPEAYALTNERLFYFVKGHFKTVYEEMPVVTILKPEISKGFFFAHISLSAGAGIPYDIKFIPKKQGIVFFKRLQEQLSKAREAHRNAIGGTNKQAHGITIAPLTPSDQLPKQSPSNQEKSEATPTTVPEHDEHAALHHLEDLKVMLDEGLITENDYELKKQKILETEL